MTYPVTPTLADLVQLALDARGWGTCRLESFTWYVRDLYERGIIDDETRQCLVTLATS